MRIYGDLNSGNCLKVKYTADYLGLGHEWMDVDIMQGESRTPDFLRMNPQGQVPVIQIRRRALPGPVQRDYPLSLHRETRYCCPKTPIYKLKVDEWLFWEQYSHEPYIAVCRFHMLYQGKPRESRGSPGG